MRSSASRLVRTFGWLWALGIKYVRVRRASVLIACLLMSLCVVIVLLPRITRRALVFRSNSGSGFPLLPPSRRVADLCARTVLDTIYFGYNVVCFFNQDGGAVPAPGLWPPLHPVGTRIPRIVLSSM